MLKGFGRGLVTPPTPTPGPNAGADGLQDSPMTALVSPARQVKAGNYGGAAANVVTPLAIAAVTHYGIKGAQALTKVNPTRAAVRALGPGSNNSNFAEKVPSGLSDIKSADPNVNGIESMIPAAGKAKETLQNGLGTYLDAHRQMGTVRPGTPIIQATEAALPSSIAPSDRAAVMSEANRVYGGNMTTDQMRTLLAEKNAELKNFYNKSQQGQAATTVAGKYEGVLKAQRDALAKHLYETLDPDNQGAGPREIQQRTGNVTELEGAAQSKRNTAIAEKPVTPLGGLGKIVQHGARAIISPVHAGIEGGMEMQGVRHPFIGPTDATLRQAFGATGEAAPIPKYQPPPIKGLLGPGPKITPSPADTSGPTRGFQPPEWTQPPHKGLLPPARGKPIGSTQPSGEIHITPAPEGSHPVSGSTGLTYPVGSGNNRLLGEPSQIPTNPGPFGLSHGDDLVAVKDENGNFVYMPKWMRQKP